LHSENFRDMPKMKTHSSAKKRLKKTATGKIKRSAAYMNHKLYKKSTRRKRDLNGSKYVADCDMPRIKKLMPN